MFSLILQQSYKIVKRKQQILSISFHDRKTDNFIIMKNDIHPIYLHQLCLAYKFIYHISDYLSIYHTM